MDEANGPGDEAREWMTSVPHHADLVQIYRRSLALRQSSPGRSPGPVSDQVSGSALGDAPAVPAGSAFGSFGSFGSLGARSFLPLTGWWVMFTSPLSSTPTTMVSPDLYLKRSSSSESGSSISLWITRRSGRAP